MAHYAKVNNGIVTKVIVAESTFFDTYVDDSAGQWIQTSYNTRGGVHYDPETGLPDAGTPLRKNYAGIGYTYDLVRDAFIPQQPYPSWVLVESSCLWTAPVAKPDLTPAEEAAGSYYIWDEHYYIWGDSEYDVEPVDPLTQGWVLITPE